MPDQRSPQTKNQNSTPQGPESQSRRVQSTEAGAKKRKAQGEAKLVAERAATDHAEKKEIQRQEDHQQRQRIPQQQRSKSPQHQDPSAKPRTRETATHNESASNTMKKTTTDLAATPSRPSPQKMNKSHRTMAETTAQALPPKQQSVESAPVLGKTSSLPANSPQRQGGPQQAPESLRQQGLAQPVPPPQPPPQPQSLPAAPLSRGQTILQAAATFLRVLTELLYAAQFVGRDGRVLDSPVSETALTGYSTSVTRLIKLLADASPPNRLHPLVKPGSPTPQEYEQLQYGSFHDEFVEADRDFRSTANTLRALQAASPGSEKISLADNPAICQNQVWALDEKICRLRLTVFQLRATTDTY